MRDDEFPRVFEAHRRAMRGWWVALTIAAVALAIAAPATSRPWGVTLFVELMAGWVLWRCARSLMR